VGVLRSHEGLQIRSYHSGHPADPGAAHEFIDVHISARGIGLQGLDGRLLPYRVAKLKQVPFDLLYGTLR